MAGHRSGSTVTAHARAAGREDARGPGGAGVARVAVVLAGGLSRRMGRPKAHRSCSAAARSSRGPSPPPRRRGWRRSSWPSPGRRCRRSTVAVWDEPDAPVPSPHRARRRARAGGRADRRARVRHAVRAPGADRAARGDATASPRRPARRSPPATSRRRCPPCARASRARRRCGRSSPSSAPPPVEAADARALGINDPERSLGPRRRFAERLGDRARLGEVVTGREPAGDRGRPALGRVRGDRGELEDRLHLRGVRRGLAERRGELRDPFLCGGSHARTLACRR